jgi:hypothetical protein
MEYVVIHLNGLTVTVYLPNRLQFVQIDNVQSSTLTMTAMWSSPNIYIGAFIFLNLY